VATVSALATVVNGFKHHRHFVCWLRHQAHPIRTGVAISARMAIRCLLPDVSDVQTSITCWASWIRRTSRPAIQVHPYSLQRRTMEAIHSAIGRSLRKYSTVWFYSGGRV